MLNTHFFYRCLVLSDVCMRFVRRLHCYPSDCPWRRREATAVSVHISCLHRLFNRRRPFWKNICPLPALSIPKALLRGQRLRNIHSSCNSVLTIYLGRVVDTIELPNPMPHALRTCIAFYKSFYQHFSCRRVCYSFCRAAVSEITGPCSQRLRPFMNL